MALLTDRILYRLSAVWWTAIYGGLSVPADRKSAAVRVRVLTEMSLADAEISVAA